MSSYEDLMKTLLKEAIEKEKLEEGGRKKTINILMNTDASHLQQIKNLEKGEDGDPTIDSVYKSQRPRHEPFSGGTAPSGKTYRDLVSAVRDVANNIDDITVVSAKDVSYPYMVLNTSGSSQQDKVEAQENISQIDTLKTFVNDANKQYIEDAKQFGLELAASLNNKIPDDENRKKAILSFKQELFSPTISLEDALKNTGLDTLIGGGVYDPFSTPDISSVDTSGTFKYKGKKAIFNDYETFYTRAKNSAIQTFNNVRDMGVSGRSDPKSPATSIRDGLQVLSNFSSFITKDNAKEVIKNYNLQQSMQFMTNAAAYLALADISRTTGGVGGGLLFEKYLAIAFNIPVAGGSNGAADNIGQLLRQSNNKVYLSAKMFQKNSIRTVSQSLDGNEGVNKLVKENKQTVLYISVAKATPSGYGQSKGKSEETEYTSMLVYISTLSWDPDAGEYYGSVLNEDGRSGARYKCETDGSKVLLLPKDAATFDQLVPNPTYTIQVPVIDQVKSSLTRDYLNQVTQNAGNKMIDGLKRAFVSVEKLSDKMVGYRNVKSSGAQVQTQIDEMFTEYTAVFDSIKELFSSATEGSAEKQSEFSKTQTFTEANQLIDIIREMVENELKDIDFE